MLLLFIILDAAMYWRSNWQTETAANEIMAKLQLTQGDKCQEETVLPILENQFGGITFSCTSSSSDKISCTSSETIEGGPKFLFQVNCADSAKNNIRIALSHRYKGALIFRTPVTIFSSPNAEIQKF
jgi:hypothetical protein